MYNRNSRAARLPEPGFRSYFSSRKMSVDGTHLEAHSIAVLGFSHVLLFVTRMSAYISSSRENAERSKRRDA